MLILENFTTYFTLLGSAFIRAWHPKKTSSFEDLNKFHQSTFAIRLPQQLGTGELYLSELKIGEKRLTFHEKVILRTKTEHHYC